MTDLELRTAIWQAPAMVESLRLTPFQHATLTYVKSVGTATTSLVAKHNKSCMQSASAVLKVLRRKGYLDRYDTADPTGGYFYSYKFNLNGGGDY